MTRGIRAGAAALVLAVAGAVAADVALETPGEVESLGEPSAHWALVADLLLRRNALLDLDSGKFLGLISTGYNAITAVAPRRPGELYVPETFYSRGSRGERTDVVTIYDVAQLAPVGEVEIPAKRALNVLPTANTTLTDDDRFLLVFNLTPGTSVSVVDTRERTFVGEIPLPGCSLVYAAGDRRFFSICGDGALLVVTLDDAGRRESSVRSERLFDPQTDPVTEKAVRAGDRWIFASFEGMVHTVDVSGAELVFEEPWSLFTDADREDSWRIGGDQHLAVHEGSGRLFSLVHQGGADTHKLPGTELWVYDLARRERVGKIELVHPGIDLLGQSAAFGQDWVWPFNGLYEFMLGMAPNEASHVMVTRDDAPLLVTGSRIGGSISVYDALTGEFLRRVSAGNLTVQRLDAPFDGGGSR
jgi:methylamine dehydrogenase heavy chain